MIDSLHSLTRNPLPAITALNLRGNRLQSLAGVEKLYPLERLDLRDNRITDPLEVARLTGIPDIREIWVEGNPFTKTHRDYRITIFNLFRKTPGYTEDIVIDNVGPSYSERRYLVERAPVPAAVPVVKAPTADLPAVNVSKPAIIYDDPVETLSSSRKERPTPKAITSEVNTSSTRRRKAPKRRIVDLATPETALTAAAAPAVSPSASAGIRVVTENVPTAKPVADIYRTTQLPKEQLLPPVVLSDSRKGISQPAVPRLDATVVPELPPLYTSENGINSWKDSQEWDVSGELYRQKIEALRDKENGVAQATRDAKRFYKKTMKGRIWADNQVVAHALAATHRHALTDHAPDESQMTGAKLSMMGDSKKGQPGKPIWKLPSGAPVIPRTVFDIVEMALSRFPFRKRKDFVSEACRYWTLKREARRGAALLKRLQLQMETFSSMELTRRNFAGMGPSGKTRLQRRIEFAETLLRDLEQLKDLSAKVVEREQLKLEAAELEQDFVDTCYFPVAKLFFPVVEKALALDKGVFYDGLVKLQSQLDVRFYTTTLAFAHDLCEVISVGINTEIKKVETADEELVATTLGKVSYEDPRQRKTLGKRILKAVQPQLETALRTEAEISSKPLDPLTKELEGMLEASIEFKSLSNDDGEKTIDADHDVVMADASIEEITVANGHVEKDRAEEGGDVDAMEVDAVGEEDDGSIEVATSNIDDKGKLPSSSSSVAGLEGNGKVAEQADAALTNGVAGASDTPPASDGYQSNSAPEQPAPPTPPQSIGSLGAQSNDPLSEGGLAWHLKDFKLRGTTILADQWPGRDAIRSLSEELSDMDDRELEGLGFDVDDSTITASPNGAAASSEVIVDTIVSKAKASTRVRKKTRSSTRRR
ncbi:hypothetical protein BN1723_007578 [Verticillium longisporum]|uniref:Uncharacterized protein n=1 Tax=Verticillium longisporum TaxID=100787 RepID=A0A0G4NM87_VERLO|nr:hypothetical protein BN1723_007578 [Verticillium longisporum]